MYDAPPTTIENMRIAFSFWGQYFNLKLEGRQTMTTQDTHKAVLEGSRTCD
jgi:hypothetical protein